MIKTLRTKNIFTVLNSLVPITNLVEVFESKPSEDYVESTLAGKSYLYLTMPTNETKSGTDSGSEGGSIIKESIVSFNIIAGTNSVLTDSELLDNIIDTINQEIVDEGCQKITDLWDGIDVKKVTEGSTSSIVYNTKNRSVKIKQYLFTYYAK